MGPAQIRNLKRERAALELTIKTASAALEKLPPIPPDGAKALTDDCPALLSAAQAATTARETASSVATSANNALSAAEMVETSAWAEYEASCS